MNPLRIRTGRLDIIPATIEMLEADRENREGGQALARLLDAAVPPSWPPPLLDDETFEAFIRMASDDGDPFFTVWYWVRDEPDQGGRVLIGSGGIATSPTEKDSLTGGTVVIGYSVLDEFQRRGYATEAVHHLIPAVFSITGIWRIKAMTYPDLAAPIRVLEKTGFTFAGEAGDGGEGECAGETAGEEGIEEGTVVYVLEKPREPKAKECGWDKYSYC